MPWEDYRLIEAIRTKLLPAVLTATKSLILRVGLHALMRLSKEALLKIVEGLPLIKSDRPPSTKDR
jgi:hypothetical protein